MVANAKDVTRPETKTTTGEDVSVLNAIRQGISIIFGLVANATDVFRLETKIMIGTAVNVGDAAPRIINGEMTTFVLIVES